MRDDTTFASGGTPDSGTGLGDAARKVGEGIGEFGRALKERRQNVVEPVSEFVQQQPLAALAVAFGVGYVLGGGLFSRMTGRLIGIGWKLGGVAMMKNILGNLGGPSGEGF